MGIQISFVLVFWCALVITPSQAYCDKPKENSIKDIDAILIQDDVSIGIHAPIGWVNDAAAAQDMGLCAIYVQEKLTFNNSPAVIYARISDSSYQGEKGIEKSVQESVKMLKGKAPKFKLEKKSDFKSKKDISFKIRDFLNGPSPNGFESVAYFPYKKHIFIAVYSSKSNEDFEKHRKSFENFLEQVSPYSSDMGVMSGSCLYPKK